MLCFLFRIYDQNKINTTLPRVCTYVHACGVRIVFLDGAWSSWHLQVACLHLVVWTVCPVPSFVVSERTGQNRPLREALVCILRISWSVFFNALNSNAFILTRKNDDATRTHVQSVETLSFPRLDQLVLLLQLKGCPQKCRA